MNVLFKRYIIIIFLWPLLSFSNSAPIEKKLNESTLLKQVDEVLAAPMNDFLLSMGRLNNTFMEFVKAKTEKCSAPIVSIEVNEDGEKMIKKKNITKKEEKLCLFKLVNFKIDFLKRAFKGRKKYLIYAQRLQVKQLEDFEKTHLDGLKVLANKYN